MKILLGTKSESKSEILKTFIKEKGLGEFSLSTFLVDSSVTYQPLDEQTTILGSKNRAEKAVLKTVGHYDYSIGMEAGLCLVGNLYHLVCAVTVVDARKQFFTGVSKKIPLPKVVSDDVKGGKEFGESIRIYFQKNIGILSKDERPEVEGLISREEAFLEALRQAFAQLV